MDVHGFTWMAILTDNWHDARSNTTPVAENRQRSLGPGSLVRLSHQRDTQAKRPSGAVGLDKATDIDHPVVARFAFDLGLARLVVLEQHENSRMARVDRLAAHFQQALGCHQ